MRERQKTPVGVWVWQLLSLTQTSRLGSSNQRLFWEIFWWPAIVTWPAHFPSKLAFQSIGPNKVYHFPWKFANKCNSSNLLIAQWCPEVSLTDGSPGHHLACLAGLPLNMSLPVTWVTVVSLTGLLMSGPLNICPSFPTYPHDKNSVFPNIKDLLSRGTPSKCCE